MKPKRVYRLFDANMTCTKPKNLRKVNVCLYFYSTSVEFIDRFDIYIDRRFRTFTRLEVIKKLNKLTERGFTLEELKIQTAMWSQINIGSELDLQDHLNAQLKIVSDMGAFNSDDSLMLKLIKTKVASELTTEHSVK